MVSNLIRIARDHPSDLFKAMRNRQALYNTHADIERSRRREIERGTLERTRVRAASNRSTSNSRAINTGSTSSRSTNRLRNLSASVIRSRNEGNVQGRRSVTNGENSNVRNQRSISFTAAIRGSFDALERQLNRWDPHNRNFDNQNRHIGWLSRLIVLTCLRKREVESDCLGALIERCAQLRNFELSVGVLMFRVNTSEMLIGACKLF